MAEMKGIKLCGECGNYDWKKHKCKIGCNNDSNAQASFYGDCPLPDVVPKSEDMVSIRMLKKWLYSIAINNVGCVFNGDFSDACCEIISRLDGLKRYAKDMESEGEE